MVMAEKQKLNRVLVSIFIRWEWAVGRLLYGNLFRLTRHKRIRQRKYTQQQQEERQRSVALRASTRHFGVARLALRGLKVRTSVSKLKQTS